MKHYTITLLLLILCSFTGFSQSSEELGIASYYSDDFHGFKTASGELYDKNRLTAAHKTIPYGTIIRVTRLDNKKSVQVRVIDRGPYIQGRIVEVSRKAAEDLDLIGVGKAQVKIEVVRNPGSAKEMPVVTTTPPPPAPKPEAETVVAAKPKVNKSPKPTNYDTTTPKVATTKNTPSKAVPKDKAKVVETPKSGVAKAGAVLDSALDTKLVTSKDYSPYGLYKIDLSKPKSYGFGVQVAAVSDHNRMMQQVAEYQGKWFKNVLVNIEKGNNGQSVYKIILGSFKDRASANNYKSQLKKKKKISGFVVDLSDLNKDG